MLKELNYYQPPIEPRHHTTYFALDPLEYAGLVSTVNQSTHEFYSRLFSSDVKLLRGECIIVVGSDGKNERHAQSRTEFELILPWPDNQEVRDHIMRVLYANQKHIHLELGPKKRIEVKVLTDAMPVSYAFGDSQRVYPDRLFNSALILGSVATHLAIREKVLAEMTAPTELGRRIRDKLKDQLSEHCRAIKTGTFRKILNFDPNTGTQFYQEEEAMQTGFKPAYIRAIQRKFDILTVLAIQKRELDASDVLGNLSTTTHEKFDFFVQRGLLKPELAEKTAQAYMWFLQQYHHIQEHYKTEQCPVMLPVRRQVFTHYAGIVQRFLQET